MDPGEFIRWMGCSFYMGFWVGISNRRNCWSTAEPKISRGMSFILNNYMARTRFEGILVSLRYRFQKDVGCYDGLSNMSKMEEAWNLNMPEDFNPSWINVLDESMMD